MNIHFMCVFVLLPGALGIMPELGGAGAGLEVPLGEKALFGGPLSLSGRGGGLLSGGVVERAGGRGGAALDDGLK